jgi:hypothetical protein
MSIWEGESEATCAKMHTVSRHTVSRLGIPMPSINRCKTLQKQRLPECDYIMKGGRGGRERRRSIEVREITIEERRIEVTR